MQIENIYLQEIGNFLFSSAGVFFSYNGRRLPIAKLHFRQAEAFTGRIR